MENAKQHKIAISAIVNTETIEEAVDVIYEALTDFETKEISQGRRKILQCAVEGRTKYYKIMGSMAKMFGDKLNVVRDEE